MFESTTLEQTPKIGFIGESRINPQPPPLVTLHGGFSTGEARYQFELKSNGTGTIFYPDCGVGTEDFTHQCELQTLNREIEEAVRAEIEGQGDNFHSGRAEIEKINQAVTAEKLEEIFWEEINQTLEDPFFRAFEDESEWSEEFHCERGTTAELVAFLELCVLTEKEIADPNDYLVIDAETECEASGLSDVSYYSARLAELVEIACGYFKPVGHRYDYNDGCYDRYSGYSRYCESLSISLKESATTPVREKMLGMIKLRKKLVAIEIEKEKIEQLTAF